MVKIRDLLHRNFNPQTANSTQQTAFVFQCRTHLKESRIAIY